MGSVVYALCALTSLACCVLLVRGFLRQRTKLLLWSGLCFAALAFNNAMLFVDLVIVPGVDLSVTRGLAAVGALLILLYGLVWDTK